MARASACWSLVLLACACTRAAEPSADEAEHDVARVAVPDDRGVDLDLRDRRLDNPYAYIPPQCYLRTVDAAGNVHNPCFTCHTGGVAPNYVDDLELQLAYDFADPARHNRWANTRVDRRAAVAAADEAEVLAWVRDSNYFDDDGAITLAAILGDLPAGWDIDGDDVWSGYTPDCWFAFDDRGFDRDPAGTPTGWRAYAAPPFPGFWPADGMAGDTMIRLPAPWREHEDGRFDLGIYALNLAIVEALMTRRDVVIAPSDEAELGVDLDRDGTLAIATKVAFRWAPRRGETMQWVGRARELQARGEAPLAAGLLPVGTEILHSVRYLDVDADGRVTMAARMKELRYARKRGWRSYGELEQAVAAETKEKHDHPDRLRQVFGDVEHGVLTGTGWVYQGFIEDRHGELRPQTFEESVFCVGCHSGVGATSDGIFSLARKPAASTPDGGWQHPLQADATARAELRRRDGRGEIASWIEQSGAASDGPIPSRSRALALDVAYREIVRAQSFTAGRDATIVAADAWDVVPAGESTGITAPVSGR